MIEISGKVVLLIVLSTVIGASTFRTGLASVSRTGSLTPEGRQKTDRSIVMKIVVDVSAEKAFELWSTVEGTRKFFGADAAIDLRPGGSYEIYFLPREEPQSELNSTKGAKLLGMEPNRNLVFEWTAPPFAAELNVEPLPTWVEVSFQSLSGQPGKTELHLVHHGFHRGGNWDVIFEFFVRGWASILYRFDLLCSGVAPARPFRNLQ